MSNIKTELSIGQYGIGDIKTRLTTSPSWELTALLVASTFVFILNKRALGVSKKCQKCSECVKLTRLDTSVRLFIYSFIPYDVQLECFKSIFPFSSSFEGSGGGVEIKRPGEKNWFFNETGRPKEDADCAGENQLRYKHAVSSCNLLHLTNDAINKENDHDATTTIFNEPFL